MAAIFARRRLVQASGVEQARLARDAYGYFHLPMVAGIVLFAFGLKTTLGHVGEALDIVPAVGLCGGAALYLLAHIKFIRRSDRFLRRGLTACQAEWQLIATTHNLLKLWRAGLAQAGTASPEPLAPAA